MYSIKEFAKLNGVTVRTLQFYDRLGILKANYVNEKHYRFYTIDSIGILKQILVLKEIGLSLREMKDVIGNQDKFRKVVEERKENIVEKIRLLNLTLNDLNKFLETKSMSSFDIEEQIEEIEQKRNEMEARDRWGNTDAYRQSMEKYSKMSKSDLERIKKEGKEIMEDFAALMREGISVEDPRVQELVAQYHRFIGNFYECDLNILGELARMYTADFRFTRTFEKIQEGLSKYMSEAILYYVQVRSSF